MVDTIVTKNKIVYAYIAGATLIFSSMETALKLSSVSLDPLQITFLRFFIGGIALLPFAIYEYRKKDPGFLTGKDWLYVIFLGAVKVPCCMVLFQLGVVYSNASTAAVIFSSNSIFTMLFAHFLTSDDKMSRRKALVLVLGAAGLLMMIRPWDIQEGNTLAGMLFSLIAAALFGFYMVMSGKTVARVGVFLQTSMSFLSGALILLVVLLILGRPILTGTTDNIGIILYAGIVVTGGGYLLLFLTQKNANATMASLIFFLKPVIAPIFAVLLLGDIITYNMYIGIALILVAFAILLFRKKSLKENDTAKK